MSRFRDVEFTDAKLHDRQMAGLEFDPGLLGA